MQTILLTRNSPSNDGHRVLPRVSRNVVNKASDCQATKYATVSCAERGQMSINLTLRTLLRSTVPLVQWIKIFIVADSWAVHTRTVKPLTTSKICTPESLTIYSYSSGPENNITNSFTYSKQHATHYEAVRDDRKAPVLLHISRSRKGDPILEIFAPMESTVTQITLDYLAHRTWNKLRGCR